MTIITTILPVMLAIIVATIVMLLLIKSKRVTVIRGVAISSIALMYIPIIILFIKRIMLEDDIELIWALNTWSSVLLNSSSLMQLNIPLTFKVDIVSAWMLIAINSISLTMTVLGHYIKTRHKWYYICSLMLYLLSVIAILSNQALVLMVSVYTISVLLFYMIGIWSRADQHLFATRFIFIQTLAFSLILLGLFIMQFIVLNSNEQSLILQQKQTYIETYAYLNISQIGYRNLAVLFIISGFALLAPIVGAHRAIRDIFTFVHYPVLIGLVGLYLPLIAYMFKQIAYSFFIDYIDSIQPYITAICVLQICYMAINLWKAKGIKEWAGYFTLASLPIVYILLVSQQIVTLSFALLAIISFMLTMSLLISIIASLQERQQGTDLEQLNGLFSSQPYLSSIIVITFLAASGFPLFSHYFSVFHAFYAVYDMNGFIFIICLTAVFLVAINVFLHMSKLFIKEHLNVYKVADLRLSELIPNIFLIGLVFMLGIFPSVFLERVEVYASDLLGWLVKYREVIIWDTDFYFSLFVGDSIKTNLQFFIAATSVILLLIMFVLGSKQNQKMLHWVYWQASYFACVGLIILVSANLMQTSLVWKHIIIYGVSVVLIFVGTHYLLSRNMYRSSYEDALHYEGLYYKNKFLFVSMTVLIVSIIGLPFSAIGIMRAQFLAQLVSERYILLAFILCLSFSFILRPLWYWLASITFPVINERVLNSQEQIEDWTWTKLEKRLVIAVISSNVILGIIYILI